MSFFYFKSRKWRRPLQILLIIILLECIFISCSLFSKDADMETLSIKLPDWPPSQNEGTGQNIPAATFPLPAYPPISRWKITLAKADGISIFHTVPDSQVEITIPKNCPFSLQAQPITLLEDGRECLYFHPAGYIYPSSEQNKASWQDGYAAFIMEGIYKNCQKNGFSNAEAARYVSSFNWQKILSLIQTKITASFEENQKFYNSWLCDSGKIIKNLSDAAFRASLLNPSACYQLSTQKLYEETKLAVLSPFIPENSFISIKGQITVKKDFSLLLSDAKKIGVFLTYLSAKNLQFEYSYIPIYKERYE